MNDRQDSVLKEIKALQIPYESLPCDPDLADTADFCRTYGFAPENSANAILLSGKPKENQAIPFVLCILLATYRLDVNGVIRKKLDVRKSSFANAEATRQLTGMEIGGVTPFGLQNQLPIWIDRTVLTRQKIVIGGGSRDRKLLISPNSLLAIAQAEVVEDLAKPAVPILPPK